MKRGSSATAAVLLALGVTAGGVTPAIAAELPEGAQLFALSDNYFYSAATDGQLTELAELPPTGGKYGADVDPTTGLGYFFTDGATCTIYSIDVNSLAIVELFSLEYVGDFDECDALDVDRDGTLRVGDEDGLILTIDKATGAIVSSVQSDIPSLSFISQAPDGTYYAGSYDGGLFSLDPATGAGTLIDDSVGYFETGGIDEAGTLWFVSGGDECFAGLYSLNVASPSDVTFQGDLRDVDECQSTWALMVPQSAAPAPQLAATGSPIPAALMPVGALALVAGILVVLAAARRRAA